MPLALVSELSRNLLIRTLIATAAVFLFLGLATGALPVKCLTQGLTECGAVPSVAARSAATTPFRFAPPAAAVKVAAAEPPAPTLTDNDVVMGSFSALKADLMAPPQTFQVASLTKPDSSAPPVRSVKTVAIRADGTPDVAASDGAVQVADVASTVPEIAPLVAPGKDDSAADAIAAAAPATDSASVEASDKLALVAEPSPPPKAKKASSSKGGKSTVVTGSGANVHAAGKGSSPTLFALAGGSKVKVLESSHGWVHITDAQGRSGWMYKDYLAL